MRIIVFISLLSLISCTRTQLPFNGIGSSSVQGGGSPIQSQPTPPPISNPAGPATTVSLISGNNQTGSIKQADLSWNLQTTTGTPGEPGWMTLLYDYMSQSTVIYTTVANSSSIYATDVYFYNTLSNNFAHLGGTGDLGDICPADTATWPGDRHPLGQTAVDTKRNFYWLWGGLNQTCDGSLVVTNGNIVTIAANTLHAGSNPFATDGSWNGIKLSINGVTYTVASVQSETQLTLTTSAGSQSTAVQMFMLTPNLVDMYYLQLNTNPMLDTWHEVFPAHIPRCNGYCSMVYDSDDDALFAFGYDGGANNHDNWLYCPTIGATPGVLTPAQTNVGCTTPDDWTEITPFSGTVSVNGTAVTLTSGAPFYPGMAGIDLGNTADTRGTYPVISVTDSAHAVLAYGPSNGSGISYYVNPPGVFLPSLTYDTQTKSVYLLGGSGGSYSGTDVWSYDMTQHIWTQRALGSSQPPAETNSTNMVAIALDTKKHVIYYHQTSGPVSPADWKYDIASESWTRLVTTGSGAIESYGQNLLYDPVNNLLVGWNYGSQIWHGSLTTSAMGGQPLANPFVVKVTDASGNSVSGVSIQFAVTVGGGTLSATNVKTDVNGLASTTLTIGSTPGPNVVTATSGSLIGSPSTFNAVGD